MKLFESAQSGLVFVVLQNGEDLLVSIREAARQAGIHTGVLTSGIGSLQKGRIHTVLTNDLPPQELYLDLPGPLEVSSYTGIIAAYQPHVHITFMNAEGKMWGGHLEEGCEVLTLAEFSIRKVDDLRLARRKPEGGLFPLLDKE